MRNSLRFRLTTLTIGLAIIPLFVVGVILAQRTFAFERDQALLLQSQVAQNVAAEVQSYVQDVVNDLTTLGGELRGATEPDQAQQLSLMLNALSSGDYRDVYQEFALLDGQGQELVRLSRQDIIPDSQLVNRQGRDEFEVARASRAAYFGPIVFDDRTNEAVTTLAIPIYAPRSVQLNGVLVATVRLITIGNAVSRVRTEQDQTVYVTDANGRVVAHQDRAAALEGQRIDLPAQADIRPGLTGVSAFVAVDDLLVGSQVLKVVAERPEATALALANATATTLIAVSAIALLAAVSLGGLAVRRIVLPIEGLVSTAKLVASGDLNHEVNITSRDEIGTLGLAFNAMTAQVRSLIDSLETRVEMRTAQLQVSAEVGRAATSILDPDQLLREIVQLITARFGFYYAAVFLTDALGQWALLREASGPGDVAWVLKQSGHKLQMGGKSMVSAAISQRQPRIALDVGVEAVRFANPLLPDTRSEIALPLIIGDQVMGALDVQSTQMSAFDEASATVLQTMADQIAIALTNAAQYRRERARAEQTTGLLEAALELSSQPDESHLYERIEEVSCSLLGADGVGLWFAVDQDRLELRHTINVGPTDLTGRQLRTGEGLVGKVYASGLILRVDDYLAWMGRASIFADAPFHSAMAVPLMWQNRTLGVLAITRSKPGLPFTVEEENLAQLLAAQTAAALDNLRLRAAQAQAVEDLNILNRRLTGEAWQTLNQTLTYEHRQTAARPATPELSVQLPIDLRGISIGTLTLEDERARTFTADEQALITGVTRQLALALENQRLTDIAQSAAQRNRAIAETADKIHQLTDLDAILQVAVTELSRITGVSGVGVQLGFGAAKTNGHTGHPADQTQENV